MLCKDFDLYGKVVWHYKDGSKKEETRRVKGKVHGTQIECREDGSNAMETLYENGKEISRKRILG
jgi:antitoxin component YwqK of YwqJK toxin-antitoxin module